MSFESSSIRFARVNEDADAPTNMSTPYTLRIGDTFTGELTLQDIDIVRLDVELGTGYEISLSGGAAGGLRDPYIYLLSDNGTILDRTDRDSTYSHTHNHTHSHEAPNTFGHGPECGCGCACSNESDAALSNNAPDTTLTYTAAFTGSVFLWVDTRDSTDAGEYELSIRAGANGTAPSAGTYEELADYLVEGSWAHEGIGRHTFEDNTITVNLNGLTAGGQQLARWALDAWEMVADVTFSETQSSSDITFTDNRPGAFSSFVAQGETTLSSTVNVSETWLDRYGTSIDSYSLSTFIHEIGHSLGLGHLGRYDGNADYFRDAVFGNDSEQLSVMSYFAPSDNPTVEGSDAIVVTAQMVDLLAIQDLYGAARGGETQGSTTYGVNSTLDNYLGALFDALTRANGPDIDGVAFTIFDEGGRDLLDFSTDAEAQTIDLRDGSFSSVYGLVNNVGIAVGTVIEDVHTGQARDTVHGNSAHNHIRTGDGDDAILIGTDAGRDTLDGGAGRDTLHLGYDFAALEDGRTTADGFVFSGQNGTITATDIETFVFTDQTFTSAEFAAAIAGAGNPVPGEVFPGSSGDDNLTGTAGDDLISGRAGNDSIMASAGNDTVEGGIGFDTIHTGAGNDSVAGNNGYDLLFGGAGNDTLVGNNGFDTIYGEDGSDLIYGGVSPDALYGGEGNDILLGQAGFDTLSGDDGNDFINGNAGADLVTGGAGNDTLEGGLNNDTLLGGGGNDRISASNGRDVLDGGFGDDVLRGNAGNDTLSGGAGNDTLNGGLASDTFIFSSGADIIQDFQNNNDSIIIDAALLAGSGLDPFATSIGDLRTFFDVSGNNIIGDFGGGNTLEIWGVDTFNALIDDMRIESFASLY